MSDISITITYEDIIYPERETKLKENPVEVQNKFSWFAYFRK